jgi:fatty acid desaturase
MSDSPPSNDSQRFHSLNVRLAVSYGCANLVVLLFLPLAIRGNLGGLGAHWAWLAVPVALVTNSFWALLHEAIHNLFAGQQAANRHAGRLMAIVFGSSFRILRFGHLMHHRFNRHPLDRPDCFDPAENSAFVARCRFFGVILGGLYLIEALTPLLYCLPRRSILSLLDRIYAGSDPQLAKLRQLAQQSLGSPKAIAEIRQDALAVAILYGISVFLWGQFWWVLLAFLFGRGFLISFLDNIYHFRTPVDRPDFAYNLRLPSWLQALILNMNLHRVHHHHMHLPWWRLPQQFAGTDRVFDKNYGLAALAQLRGPATIRMLISDKPEP